MPRAFSATMLSMIVSSSAGLTPAPARQQDQVGLGHQHAGELEQLLLAAGEMTRERVGQFGQAA